MDVIGRSEYPDQWSRSIPTDFGARMAVRSDSAPGRPYLYGTNLVGPPDWKRTGPHPSTRFKRQTWPSSAGTRVATDVIRVDLFIFAHSADSMGIWHVPALTPVVHFFQRPLKSALARSRRAGMNLSILHPISIYYSRGGDVTCVADDVVITSAINLVQYWAVLRHRIILICVGVRVTDV